MRDGIVVLTLRDYSDCQSRPGRRNECSKVFMKCCERKLAHVDDRSTTASRQLWNGTLQTLRGGELPHDAKVKVSTTATTALETFYYVQDNASSAEQRVPERTHMEDRPAAERILRGKAIAQHRSTP